VDNGTIRNNKIHVVVPYYIIVLSYCLVLRDRGLYVRKWRSADAKGDINGVAFFIFIDELLQKKPTLLFPHAIYAYLRLSFLSLFDLPHFVL